MAQTASKKWLGVGLVVVVLFVALFFWNKHRQSGSNELVIGISPPFAKTLQAAADEAKQQGLNVKLVEFSDWNTPNITLNHGDIDANFFQHQPFLDNAIKETGFKLKAFAVGAASHVGLYSKKYKSLDELPQNARVVIPNDPVNQGRALLLLQQAKLITLKDSNNPLSALKDVVSNPKNLQFIEVELWSGKVHQGDLVGRSGKETDLPIEENVRDVYKSLISDRFQKIKLVCIMQVKISDRKHSI